MFLSKEGQKISGIAKLVNVSLVMLVVAVFVHLSIRAINVTLDFSFVLDNRIRITDGFLMTLQLSGCAMIISMVIGIISATLSYSKIIALQFFNQLYIKVIRGTPLLMQIYLFFYIIGTAWGVRNRFFAGVVILSIFEGAYISEIIRASYNSIDETQKEAGLASGFTKHQTIRYVIIPQMLARTLPALTGQFASIIKDSSLLSMIAVIELTQVMKELSATNFKMFECYFLLGVLYLVITLPVTLISERLEKNYTL